MFKISNYSEIFEFLNVEKTVVKNKKKNYMIKLLLIALMFMLILGIFRMLKPCFNFLFLPTTFMYIPFVYF